MDADHDAVRELPPSAKLVFKALQYEGPMTQCQLAAETLLPPRTVRDAVTRLEDVGVLEERIFIPDARKSTYVLADDASANPA